MSILVFWILVRNDSNTKTDDSLRLYLQLQMTLKQRNQKTHNQNITWKIIAKIKRQLRHILSRESLSNSAWITDKTVSDNLTDEGETFTNVGPAMSIIGVMNSCKKR